MSIVGSLATLRRLYVEGVRLPNLNAFAELTSLEVLSIDGCTRVTSLDELAPLCGVEALGITHFPKVHSLQPLTQFRALTALVVAGGMWARMTVDSLSPLASLLGLRFLHLTDLKALDESLEPLLSITGLKRLDLPNFYPMEEFARLSARLPKTQCTWFEPVVPLSSSPCQKCGQPTLVLLTGKGMPSLCSLCDSARVKKHVEHFRSVVAKAA